jgi:ribonucleotide monophosphatase NagD (HAD superfamily)
LKAQEEFRPIELILVLGEPVNWECSLQLLLDVLMTNGDPRQKFKFVPEPHLPIIACNKDVTFKGSAMLPRFGNGAFLECLEALYMVSFSIGFDYPHIYIYKIIILY